MRFLRDDRPELWEDPPPVFRDDHLRDLVDSLPKRQQHMVSRVYFGGASMEAAAAEIRISPLVAKRLLDRALGSLRRALQEED
jgi:DNA-directed RNA polymerase specialized sigma24 family protein